MRSPSRSRAGRALPVDAGRPGGCARSWPGRRARRSVRRCRRAGRWPRAHAAGEPPPAGALQQRIGGRRETALDGGAHQRVYRPVLERQQAADQARLIHPHSPVGRRRSAARSVRAAAQTARDRLTPAKRPTRASYRSSSSPRACLPSTTSAPDDAHLDARRSRGCVKREEVAHGCRVLAEAAVERARWRHHAWRRREWRVAGRTGERPNGQKPRACGLTPLVRAGWSPGRLRADWPRSVDPAGKHHAISLGPYAGDDARSDPRRRRARRLSALDGSTSVTTANMESDAAAHRPGAVHQEAYAAWRCVADE